MLEVALTPAPVALHLLEQRGGRLLVAPGEVVGEPERVARAPEQRRLDEVVAQDLAAERRPAGQPRQPAVLHERRDAEDRVVAPVLAVAELPEVEARRRRSGRRAGSRTAGCARRASAARARPARSGSRPTSGCASMQPHERGPAPRRSSRCRRRARSCSGSGGPSAGRSRRCCRSCAPRARGGAGRRPGRSRPRGGTSRTTPPPPATQRARDRRCRRGRRGRSARARRRARASA